MNPIAYFLALMLTSSFAQANHTVAEVKAVDGRIQSIELNESGVLKITFVGDTFAEVVGGASTREMLLDYAHHLRDTELTKEHHAFICMMVRPPFVQDLYIANTADGALTLTLSMESCAFTDSTFPKDPNLKKLAEELKFQMLDLVQKSNLSEGR